MKAILLVTGPRHGEIVRDERLRGLEVLHFDPHATVKDRGSDSGMYDYFPEKQTYRHIKSERYYEIFVHDSVYYNQLSNFGGDKLPKIIDHAKHYAEMKRLEKELDGAAIFITDRTV